MRWFGPQHDALDHEMGVRRWRLGPIGWGRVTKAYRWVMVWPFAVDGWRLGHGRDIVVSVVTAWGPNWGKR